MALGGHSHSIENLREGDRLAGWSEVFGVDGLPVTHITAGPSPATGTPGACCPMAIQRDGRRPGVLALDIENTRVAERFTVRGEDASEHMALSLNTPRHRAWSAENVADKGSAPEFESPLAVSREDLDGTTWLTGSFWMGGTGSTVDLRIDGGEPDEAVRTQQMPGEGQLVGAEWSDPVAVQEQLVHGGSLADRTMHLWRLQLSADLAVGEHTAEVTVTDVHGRQYTQTLAFEVTEQSAPPRRAPERRRRRPPRWAAPLLAR